MDQNPEIRRLHWGCGEYTPANWINSDIRPGPGVDIACDVLHGIPLDDSSIDYISGQHVLPEIKIYDQVKALRELHRILKPDGVLRLSLPDLDKAIDAYQNRRQSYFQIWDWYTVSGNFITQILWYNTIHTPFTHDFADELLRRAGFREVHRAEYRKTTSRFPEIVELDNRAEESFYIEAVK